MSSTIQMPGNYPKEIIQHSKHGKSLKSRIQVLLAGKKEYRGGILLLI
jgi:hypothetical protein